MNCIGMVYARHAALTSRKTARSQIFTYLASEGLFDAFCGDGFACLGQALHKHECVDV